MNDMLSSEQCIQRLSTTNKYNSIIDCVPPGVWKPLHQFKFLPGFHNMDDKLSPLRLSQIVAWIQNKNNMYLEKKVYYDNLAKLLEKQSSPQKIPIMIN